MSAYDAPTEDIGVFNSSLFTSTSENITQSYADTHYLKYPTAQTATETINSLTATTLTATNDATINGLTVGKGGSSIGTNTAFGDNALQVNTTGANNVAIGTDALLKATSSSKNTAVGSNALTNTTIGNNNTAVGNSSLSANISGGDNTSVGDGALFVATGSNNTAVGYDVLGSNTSGSNNTAIGHRAGKYGTPNTTGSSNTYIGYQAQANANNYSNSTALGADSIITASNQIVLGTTNETVRYDKVSPLYSAAIPTYTNANIGYRETVGNSSITSITSTVSVLMTSSSLPIGTYILCISAQFNDAVGALELTTSYRVGAATRKILVDSVVSGKDIAVSLIDVIVLTTASVITFRAATSTGTITALTGNTDDTILTIVRIA